jgi:dihydroorotase
MNEAPFGICGVETLVPLIYDRFVRRGVISLTTMIQSLTANPARVLGLQEGGRISPGEAADLTVIDPRKPFVIDESFFLSRSVNSPFLGWRGRGSVAMTIVAGEVVYREPG